MHVRVRVRVCVCVCMCMLCGGTSVIVHNFYFFSIFQNNDVGFYTEMNEIIRNHSHGACKCNTYFELLYQVAVMCLLLPPLSGVVFMSLPPPPKDESLSQDYLQKLTNLTGNDKTGLWLHGCLCVWGWGGGRMGRHACFMEPNVTIDVFILEPSY